ncbi:MAG: hypothetical protein IPK60_02095 [Sandaracinaceae bacterium]|jgi:tetratricopeptide (TPR) repeat protein|nr:hypothetical protein [Sandaracinaceae bacterium]
MNASANLDAVRLAEDALQNPADLPAVRDALTALAEVASRRAVDEPLLDATAAHAMVKLSRAALAKMSGPDRLVGALAGPLWLGLSQGLRLANQGDLDEAMVAVERAVALDAKWLAAWKELGTVQKWRGAWGQACTAYQHAYALAPHDKRLCLDVALCALASGQGSVAVACFAAIGLPAELSPGGMPFVPGLPSAELRVATKPAVGPEARPDAPARFEILQITPLSPCHGVVVTPSWGDGLVDVGDLVLWDSAPVSVRDDAASGEPVPCFALLARLREGDEKRFRFIALCDESRQLEKVAATLPRGVSLVAQREETLEGSRLMIYGKAIVPGDVELAALRRAYEAAQKDGSAIYVAMPALYEALGDTKMAGKAHQAWGGIERTARKRAGG